jgi:hypothetical protein
MEKQKMKEMLEMIDAKIEHIEDVSADNRALIVKLVKQNNQIVQFLKNLEVEMDIGEDYVVSETNTKLVKLMKLVEEFKESNEEFKEFMKELEENKDKLTPGQFGES